MLHIVNTDFNGISHLRESYLNSLPESQECFVEILVESGSYYNIFIGETVVGYAISSIDDILGKTGENVLVEFYLRDEFLSRCDEVFALVIKKLSIVKVYCKSFDCLMLNCCLMQQMQYEVFGRMFRKILPSEKFHTDSRYDVRLAQMSDYDFLLQQKGGLYETPKELEDLIGKKTVTMFIGHGQLVGCGYSIPVLPNGNYYDIGMWTNPEFRNTGVATYIISYLKDECISNNKIPVCGCAVDNIASMKTLEKNGFVSKYKLIKFTKK